MPQGSNAFLSSGPSHPAPGISLAELLDRLAGNENKTLVFNYDGRDVLPGYHVTEVKSGAFEALDCGANLENWQEAFIQLWDVPAQDGGSFMSARKFLAIIGKVNHRVPFDLGARLSFEVSDGVRPIQIYQAMSLSIDGDTVRVGLTPRPASCKPRDRWLEHEDAAQSYCTAKSDKLCCNHRAVPEAAIRSVCCAA